MSTPSRRHSVSNFSQSKAKARERKSRLRQMVIEPMEARRLLTTELGVVRPSAGEALKWELSSQLLSGPVVNHSFDYGLNAGSVGAGANGDDYARAGDLSGVGFDQAIAIRSSGPTLQWRGDTDRDLGTEYLFRFGSFDFTPLIADMNGDGIDDVIAVDTDTTSLLNEWFVHYGSQTGYPTDDSQLLVNATFSFGANGDKVQVGDINGDGRADAIAVQVDGPFLDWKIHFAESGTPYPNNTATVVSVDQVIQDYGSSNDTPVVGNWDNLGADNIGVVDSDTLPQVTWNLDTDGGGDAEISVLFGLPDSQFIVGNWADVLWNAGAETDDWSDPANWSNSTVPTLASSVVIDQPSSADAIVITTSSNVKSLISTEDMAFNANLTSVEDIDLRGLISLSNSTTITARSVSLRNATTNNHDLAINAPDTVILSGAIASTTGGVTIASARDIRLTAGGSIATTTGAISLQANQQVVASTGSFDGVFIGGPITTSTGPVTITGKSGTDTENHGVRFVAGGSLASTSFGAFPINVSGRSVGTGASDGIRFDFGGSITSAFGNIQLTGVSDNDNGIDTFLGSIASNGSSEGAATIAINGTSNGSGVGTFIGFSHLITSYIGDIFIAGQSAAGIGLEFNFTGRVQSLGNSADAANIFISGTSLATSGSAYGALLANAFGHATALAGDIAIEGTSSAPLGSGVNIGAAFTVSAGGEGTISVTGDGVSTGILLGQHAPPLIQSSSGAITFSTADSLVSSSGTTVNSGAGVTIDVEQSSTYAGNLTATGNFTKTGGGQITFNGDYNVGGSAFQGGLSSFPVTANVQSVGTSVSIDNADVDFSSGEVISSGNVTLISGTWTGTDEVVVSDRLAGTGTIASSVRVIRSATVAPGNSPGILNTGNLTMIGGSLLEIELGGLTPGNTSTDHDQINVTGTVSLAGTLSVLKFNGFLPASLDTFTIINNDGEDPIVGTFEGLAEGSSFTSDGMTFSISYVGGTGNDVVITAVGNVYRVTTTLDSGEGSFRQAILDANANSGPDTVRFEIEGTGPHVIQVLSVLPTITETVAIDGYSEPDYAGTPAIVLNGSSVTGDGLTLGAGSDRSTIRGLTINSFGGVGILVFSNSNTFHGNFIGTSADGMSASGNATWGLIVIGGANNAIGGTSAGNRNVVSGNLQGGIAVYATGANGNKIQGNLVGVNATGNADLGNGFSGIFIGDASGFSGGHTGFAINTIVGGDSVGARNIISGNNNSGLVISGSGSSGNIVRGNYIGTNLNGSAAIGNNFWGIIVNNSPENTIGGIHPDAGNLVSGNNQGGIAIFSAGAVNNVVQGNLIGVNADGDQDLGNAFSGVYVGLDFANVNGSASNNTIGGSEVSARNIISGNNNYGVWIRGSGATNNVVQGNYIGTDKNGTLKIANSWSGVAITEGAFENRIGTFGGENQGQSSLASDGNLISGNSQHGVLINGGGTAGNVIAGNRIGTTANGLNALGNYNSGVFISGGASHNTVGGTSAVLGNIISGNATAAGLPGEGVHVDGPLADGNQILGNSIGIGVDGSTAIPNGFAGIRIFQATNTIVGGLTATPGVAPGNIISANLVHGIFIDSGATRTSIQGNLIGTDVNGTLDRGNTFDGIQILSGSSNNVVGGSHANSRNVISGNNRNGILIDGVGTNHNVVAGNYIGTNRSGTGDLGNTGHGIAVSGGADDTRIGTDGSNDEFNGNERNVISGNDLWAAVVVAGEGTDRTIIAGNYIGTNKDGDAAIGSGGHSVVAFAGADDTRIGTDGNGTSDSDERNVLSGNLWGVVVEGATTFRTVIAGNYIGTNKNGNGAIPNGGSGAIEVRYGARDTRIGTDGSNDEFNENERNVISGNSTNGIFIQTPLYNGLAPAGGATTDGTIVAGNFIGVNALGTATLPNSGQGIYSRNRATNVRIGTDGNGVADFEERNVISGNTGTGILTEGWSLMGLSIAEQFVSGAYPTFSFAFTVPQADITDASAGVPGNWGFNHPVPGGGGNYFAVRATGTLQVNTAGTFSFALGSDDGGRLRINGVDVVVDDTAHAFGNRYGNATLAAGTHTFEWYGLEYTGASGFEISVAVGGGNVSTVTQANGWEVLGSTTPHLQIALVGSIAATIYYSEPGMSNTRIAGNYIGTDFGGTLDFGNNGDGIRVQFKAQGVTIGGSSSALQNVISGNNSDGIEFGFGGLNNVVSGNIIGLNRDGNALLGNSNFGVNITAGNLGTRIGTNSDNVGDAAERNIISGNLKGIQVAGLGTNQTLIAGNYIGTDINGMLDLGNIQEGVVVLNAGPIGTIVGGTVAIARNVISGNNSEGIEFSNVVTGGGIVQGNYVGLDAAGVGLLANGLGVLVRGTSGVTIGGSLAGAGNVISGNASSGVTIRDVNSFNTIVQGNLIGTDFSGTLNRGNATNGISVQLGANHNMIGGETSAERNVISGNQTGVTIDGVNTNNNAILGNYIGTDTTGQISNPNTIGVSIANGAINNVIGGWTNLPGTGAGNVISGNSLDGIVFSQTALGNSVRGNLIGLAADGFSPLANGQSGIQIFSPDAIIGGDDDDDGSADGVVSSRNVVSGNPIGISVSAAGVNLNAGIQGNFVGTNRGGTSSVPNTIGGVHIDGATGTRIGGTTARAGNVVSGNNEYGIKISGASAGVIDGLYNATIQANFIGTDVGGDFAMPNAVGVQLQNSNNLIGGSEAAKNIISGNATDGIWISGAAAFANLVQSNYIGVDANGTKSLSNATGVTINAGAALNLIGGNSQSRRNVISGNTGNGITVTAAGTLNKIQGNFIGTDFSGTRPVANASTAVFEAAGIHISSMAGQSVVVGTDGDNQNDASEGNVVSGNLRNGIRIEGGNSDSGSHVVAGNRIGVDFSATGALPNQGDGIIILSSNTNRIGTNGDGTSDAFEANVIAGNRNLGANPGGAALKASGLLILDLNVGDGRSAANNVVAGNFVGTDSSTARALGNQGAGIRIDSAAGTIIGSDNPSSSNFIYFGNDDGVQILGTAESGMTSAQTTNLLINSFTSNAGLAIDLGDDGVSLNDDDDSDGIANFPILTSVTTQNGQLTVRGVMPANKSFELYVASAEQNSSFGEGRTFLASFTEGISDLASGSGSYGPLVDNVAVSQTTITDSSFEFTIPLPAGLNTGMLVTARAKGITSEFGLLALVGEQASRIAPTISLAASAAISVGDAFQLTGSFVDPDSSSWTVTVDYGDGTGSSFLSIGANNSFTLDHTYELDGDYSVAVSVTDNSLPPVTSTAVLQLTVNNTTPQVEFNGVTLSSPISENFIASLSGSFNNANLGASHTVTIDWDDETPPTELTLPPGVREFSATHRFADDSNNDLTPSAEDTYNVQVTISSNAGANSSPLGLYLIQVQNVVPKNLVVNPSALTLSEGDTLQFSGSFFDPGVLDQHRLKVDWGDGTIEEFSLSPSGLTGPTTKSLPSLSHTYANDQVDNDDAYLVTIEVTDDDEPLNPVRYTRLFPVTNVSPSAVNLNFSSNTISEGQSVSLSGSFVDPGLEDVHRIYVDWGDGTSDTVDLQKGDRNFSVLMYPTLQHTYLNDAPGVGGYSIQVRVADSDAPQVFGIASTILDVLNVSPQITQAYLNPSGIIDEGSNVVLTGRFTDVGVLDRHRVRVNWGDGHTTDASVDSIERSFTASHQFGDNFDPANVTVTIEDGRFVPNFEVDGGVDTEQRSVQIRNVAPKIFIAPKIGSTPSATVLTAEVIDPGFKDTFLYTWSIDSGSGYIVVGNSASVTLNSTVFTAPPKIRLQVSDDDDGMDSYEVLAIFGTDNPETITVRNNSFTISVLSGDPVPLDPLPAGGNVLVMGFGDEDSLDASSLSAEFSAILDGGQGTDYLIGGAGQDRFFAHDGNDTVDGGAGSDVFKVKPNSTLTVIDTRGDNVLDFSIADFGDSSGITFDLGLINSDSLTRQDVSASHANQHFVQAKGRFTTLIGSHFNDVLVAASGSTIDGGAGADQLKVQNGAIGAVVVGGADTDILSVDLGSVVGNISFAGDIGIDTLLNMGEINGLDFSGGADNDIFNNLGTITDLSFNGDEGIDTFSNQGVLSRVNFSGGADNDVFTNTLNARISELVFGGDLGDDTFVNFGNVDGLEFTGGADNDIFRNILNAQIDNLVFTGDTGSDIFENFGVVNSLRFSGGADADVFTNSGSLLGLLEFDGGADNDVFTNRTGAIVANLNFGGDIGADVFENFGTISGTVVFGGGADNDVFTNVGTVHNLRFNGGSDSDILRNLGSVDELNFEGDLGADIFENRGQVLATITFNGGADDDILRNFGQALNLSFGGDLGSDVFENFGSVSGRLTFVGGAGVDDGADLLRNSGTVHELLFNGGADNDILINLAAVDSLTFNGGADDDIFTNTHPVSVLIFDGGADSDILSNSGIVDRLDFIGGADDDFFTNSGRIVTGLVFNGGADNDVFINQATAESISFLGDIGIDLFRNSGSVDQLKFEGGADSDTFVNLLGGSVDDLNFSGDDGEDFLSNSGTVFNLSFSGDTGIDTLVNVGSVTDLDFTGGADNDLFRNTGSVTNLNFSGGADQDVLQNDASISDINFAGDAGADILLNYGGFDNLEFTGGADDDVFASYGTLVGSINFFGDLNPSLPGFDDNVGGGDKMVIRGSAKSGSTLMFKGGKGQDAFQNDATGFQSITFDGGSDADVFQNNADGISTIVFNGDTGADVFENNGDQVRVIEFNGGADADIFVNDGSLVSDLEFNGGADNDLFINTGDNVSEIDFQGDIGSDTFANSGQNLEDILFSGGADNDSFLNSGIGLTDFVFNGDTGDDRFWNQQTGTQAVRVTFNGDLGADIFINDAAAVSNLVFSGGADNDGFQNNGVSLNQATIHGDAGDDRVVNTGAAVNNLLFVGGAGKDNLGNIGRGVGRIEFQGGADADVFVNSGLDAGELVFMGGADSDTFTNDGFTFVLSFLGDVGNDALYNNGSMRSVNFTGGIGDDLLQNNGPAQTVRFYGGEDSDALVNNASSVELIYFEGDIGVDSLISNGKDVEVIDFRGGADADYLRLQGSIINHVDFDGNVGNDTFEYDAVGSPTSVVTFTGGLGNDFLAWLGSADSATVDLGGDNDQVFLSGSGNLQLNDGGGNDSYLFVNDPELTVTIGEQFAGPSDDSVDTLDFSSFYGGVLNLDLSVTSLQPQGNRLNLQLTDSMGIEAVIGTELGDTILGNDRNNVLLGAKYFAGYSGPIARTRGETQWVLLDFDSKLDAGEHEYKLDERNAIASRIERTYRGPNTLQPWMDVRVVQRLEDLQTTGPYVTIYFNDTPAFGRPGGLASEIDLGNANLGGTAQVQVNGLVGGAVTADEAIIQPEPLPQGLRGDHGHEDETLFGDVTVGTLKPAATSDNFVRLSAKIAGHELGHLLGLRHQDAFGPIGYGIHNPPGGNAYTPVYSGPSGGFESFDHLIGSPATIGSSRFTDLNDLFFGEREAIKLAFAGSNPLDTVATEVIGSHDSRQTAQEITLVNLNVPFAQDSGFNSQKQKFVQVKSVTGRIDLGQNHKSESDFYSFSGLAGDIVNIDVFSNSLVGRFGSGADDFLDTIVRVYDSSGNLVSYHGGVAENDDQFEPTDSSLVDLVLPADGVYYIEVDSFKQSPQDPIFDVGNPSSPINPSNPNNILGSASLLKRFLDTRDDTDVGDYQLIVYRFANQNASDGIDNLKGKGGVDVLDGGPGDAYPLQIATTSDAPAALGAIFSKTIAFSDRGGGSWTAIVDFGDGSAPESYSGFDPNSGLTINHVYTTNGVHTANVTIHNDDFVAGSPNATELSDSTNFRVTVTGLGYAPSLSTTAFTVAEGKTGTFGVSLTRQPASNVTVKLTKTGDTDIQLSTTALVFTTTNWNVRQNVTISAAEDADVANGVANILVATPLNSLGVVVTEADNDRLTPVITSLAASPTNLLSIPMTINFGQSVTLFDATDVKVVGGAVSGFVDNGNGLYSFNIVPSINGTITVDVAAGAAKDIGNKTTLAAIRKTIVSDRIAPAAILTAPAKLTAATFTVTINFGEVVNGFVATDILTTNAMVTNLVSNGSGRFTATLKASSNGFIKVEVPSGVASDAAGNGNLASAQYVVATTNGIDVQLNAKQRSFERYVDLRFVTDVGLASLIANQRIALERYATNGADVNVPGTAVSITSASVVGNSIRLDFGSNGLGGVGVSGNGFYRVAIDLDDDGQFDDGRFEFFRLYGDANGDGKVDATDVSLLVDLNGDGRADVRDRVISRDQLGTFVDSALLALIDD